MKRKIVAAVSFAAISVFMSCAASKKPVLDPDSQKFYESARLIMTNEEKAIFTHLPDAESRKEFVNEFWVKRDANPDTPKNEFKEEFEQRVNYANKRFREGTLGQNTDRGRIHIYMGPPDKVDEFFTHEDSNVRGAILWWIYYNYALGIEFVDEKGDGRYKIRNYTGDFWEAIDMLKLGPPINADEVFKKKVVKLGLKYLADKKEFEVTIPVNAVSFEEDDINLKLNLGFHFYIYPQDGGKKEEFKATKSFEGTDQAIQSMENIVFAFPYELKAGRYYVDVIILGQGAKKGKTRKIFEVNVK